MENKYSEFKLIIKVDKTGLLRKSWQLQLEVILNNEIT